MNVSKATCVGSMIAAALIPSLTFAVDGVILIDQNKALAGTVTPGDSPGFPVTISQPGSYRLAGNLTAPLNTRVVVIASSDVSLDLNGFVVFCSGELATHPVGHVTCIESAVGTQNIAVHNGLVNSTVVGGRVDIGFCVDGIFLGGSSRTQLHDLLVEGNDSCNGIAGTGVNAIVRNNVSNSFNVNCPSLIIANINTSNGSGSSGAGCLKVDNLGFF